MPSVAGVRLGLCLLRYGPQPGVPFMFFCRQSHSPADPRTTTTGKLPSSCGMSTVAAQQKTKSFIADVSELSKEIEIAEASKRSRRFITNPSLVNNVLHSLDIWDHDTTSIIMECNPGPGVFTRALLDAGCNVVGLESDAGFLPSLKKLQQSADGQLRILDCDFFKLDPWVSCASQFTNNCSMDLMEKLDIREVPWDSGVLFKVFGILNHRKERPLLWRYIYFLYQRMSFFRFGRIEFNFFMSEQLYKSISTQPGDYLRYCALGVLFNVACDIQLLHKTCVSTFLVPKNFKSLSLVKPGWNSVNNMCLVRMTPKRNLFSENFTPSDGAPFVNMIRQYLVSRRLKLLKKFYSWSQDDEEEILQKLGLPANVKIGDISPETFKLMYDLLKHSEEFKMSFELNDPYTYRAY